MKKIILFIFLIFFICPNVFGAGSSILVDTTGKAIGTSGNPIYTSGGGGGTPGGSDTQVQFNDATAFGGDSGLTFNKTTDALTIGGDLTITGDDLFMNTNTSGAVLVADGTNFNPVAMSGDVTINTSGVTAIGANKITDAMMNDTGFINLPIQSAKVTGGFVVQTPTGGDASTQGAQIDASEGSWKLLFDPTTDEAAVWQFRLPTTWTAHGTIKVQYSMASATSGTVEFEGAVMCTSPGDAADIVTASFAAVAVASETVPGTAGYLSELTITPTDDSCAAGDSMWIYLSKDSNDGTNDTATGDTEVINVQYSYNR